MKPPDEAPLVVVADDDDNVRLLAGTTLKGLGLRVEVASNGTDALELVRRLKPSLTLLDVVMPGMDGFSVCERLRADPATAQLPVLMLTGLDDAASIKRAYEAGATDFVTKPVSWQLLRHRVRYMLRAGSAFTDLREHEHDLRRAQQMAHLGSWKRSSRGLFESSEELRRIFGFAVGETEPDYEAFVARIAEVDREAVEEARNTAQRRVRDYQVAYEVEHPETGTRFMREQGEVVSEPADNDVWIVATVQDVTETKAFEEQVRLMTYYDPLTGLPNRRLFDDLSAKVTQRGRDTARTAGLLYVDLAQFGRLNDAYGHTQGDRILGEIAGRIEAVARKVGAGQLGAGTEELVVARLGADEFVVLMAGISSPVEASDLAHAVLQGIAQPIAMGSEEIVVQGCVGISLMPDDAATSEELLRNAHAALMQAKASGVREISFYEGHMNATMVERMALENELHGALERGELLLHFQPIVDAGTGRVAVAEALLRWSNSRLGAVGPADFIPVAERLGLMGKIGAWVLEEALARCSEWAPPAGTAPAGVAVNLSPVQLRDPDLAARVQEILARSGLPGERLEIEFTEGCVVEEGDGLERFLKAIAESGIALSIDDFGTGYSSFGYLTRLSFDTLKIDQSFVAPLGAEPRAAKLVQAMITMAHGLGLRVIAEGVETPLQLQILRSQGCDLIQGYLFSRPLSAADFAEMMAAGGAPGAQHYGQKIAG